MKNLARGYLWWPNMDKDLERCVAMCRPCQSTRSLPLNNQPLHPWEFPSKPCRGYISTMQARLKVECS